MTHSTMTALTLLALAPPALAAAPTLPKEIKDMHCLIGSWSGTGNIAMGGPAAPIKVSMDCKPSSGGHGVLCKTRLTGVPGMASYEETDLFGFDPGTRKYHWFSVTNAGETHDHVADISSDNKMKFVFTGTQEGKSFREVIDMTFSEDTKSLAFRGETFLDNKSTSVIEAKAGKK